MSCIHLVSAHKFPLKDSMSYRILKQTLCMESIWQELGSFNKDTFVDKYQQMLESSPSSHPPYLEGYDRCVQKWT